MSEQNQAYGPGTPCSQCGAEIEQSAPINAEYCNEHRQKYDRTHAVYVSEAEYVTVDMKELTASRMVGWLRAFADHTEVEGNDVSANHARRVADRIEAEVDTDE